MLASLAARQAATAGPSCDFGLPRLSLPLCVFPVASSDALAAARPAAVRSAIFRRSISASCAKNRQDKVRHVAGENADAMHVEDDPGVDQPTDGRLDVNSVAAKPVDSVHVDAVALAHGVEQLGETRLYRPPSRRR